MIDCDYNFLIQKLASALTSHDNFLIKKST